MSGPVNDNWIITAAYSIVGGLAVAVVALWRLVRSNAAQQIRDHTAAIMSLKADNAELKQDNKALKHEAKECRKDRERLHIELAKLETRLDTYIGTHKTTPLDGPIDDL